MKRLGLPLVIVASMLVASTGVATAAAPLIRPGQLFNGFVNDQRPNATIGVVCFGPIRPGQTGHPVGGQTVAAQRSLDVPGGNMGSIGTRINVLFDAPSARVGVTFHRYERRLIPTSLTLPCHGSGQVIFAPVPSSSTARPDKVNVTYVGQP